MSRLPVPFPTKTILPSITASKTCSCITAFVSMPIRCRAPRHDDLDLLHSFNSSLVEQRNDLLISTCTSVTLLYCFSPTPSAFPLRLSPSSASSSLSLHFRSSPLSLCRCPFFSEISCLSLPFPLQPPSSLSPSLSLSFALCVRVCRWLLLAGSVTRGNWGRVHFNRTNGNKLIHFHCCFFF